MTAKKIRNQFADTMLEIGKTDPDLVVMVGDISHGILQTFAKACPGRYYNVGICEAEIISMAAGMASIGLYPVAHTIAPFLLERAYEQIKLDFCYHGLHGNIVTVGGTFDYSNLGVTHHCYCDFALIKSLPNTQYLFPGTAQEFDILFKQAYRNEHLTVYRVPEHPHMQEIPASAIKVGKGVKIADGKDLTIVVTGTQLKHAVEAKKALSAGGWDVEIIYIHSIRPFDAEMVRESVQKTRRVLVVEEHNVVGGLNEDVLRAVYNVRDVQFHAQGLRSFVHSYGSYNDLCESVGLSPNGIVRSVQEHFKKG